MADSRAACVEAALALRQALIAEGAITAYRVFNGQADGIPGLVIDRLGDVLVAQLHEGQLQLAENRAREVVRAVHQRLGTRAVYRKIFVRDRGQASRRVDDLHRSQEPWIGEPVDAERIVSEYGLRFIVRPWDGFSVGLFLEHRENRRRIRELATGRRVLNAFAYTCAFSVAAVAGGAVAVASVDLSRHYLEWGKRNFAANGLDLSDQRFFCTDIFDFYKRAARQGRRYDLIVLDPPTFARSRRPRHVFVLDQQLEGLCAGAVELLDPGGLVFLATNDRQIPRTRIEDALSAASAGRACTIVERPGLPADFAGDPDYAKAVVARLD